VAGERARVAERAETGVVAGGRPGAASGVLPQLSGVAETKAREPAADMSLNSFPRRQIAAGAENLHEEAVQRLERLLLTRVLAAPLAATRCRRRRCSASRAGSLRTKIRDLGIRIEPQRHE